MRKMEAPRISFQGQQWLGSWPSRLWPGMWPSEEVGYQGPGVVFLFFLVAELLSLIL